MNSPKLVETNYQLERFQICEEIWGDAVREIVMHMRYLDVALGDLVPVQTGNTSSWGTDGWSLFFHPDHVLNKYKQGSVYVPRALLHILFHCLFDHFDRRGERDPELWNLACDIAVETIIDGLPYRFLRVAPGGIRTALVHQLKEKHRVLTAEVIYRELVEMNLTERNYGTYVMTYLVDDHSFWESEQTPKQKQERQKRWEENRNRMETEMDTFGKEAGEKGNTLLDQIRVENRDRYDYRLFLRKFSVLKEEMQIDADAFDYIFYSYGMELYGNMPLIEPLETRELKRIEDFVIVIDTSMSCKGELVKRFLEETFTILHEGDSFFRHINVHIIQCDEKVQQDKVITSLEEFDAYMEEFTILGQGGTDFRPAFRYVNGLMKAKAFHHLRGMIYFTDGYGIFPARRPLYDTAFVFWNEDYCDLDVPPWAMKLVLTKEDLEVTEAVAP